MFYTVSEAAKILNLSPSTLRYYDKEGLIPFLEHSKSGARMFQDNDIQALRIVECLKHSGMKLSDIRRFMDLVKEGDEMISERLVMIKRQREEALRQIEEMQENLRILDYKQWYYETAEKDGTTARVSNLPLEELPEHLRETRKKIKGI